MNESTSKHSTFVIERVYKHTHLDGHDTPEQREHGTKMMLDKLGTVLDAE